MSLVQTAAPVNLPISLDEIKQYIKIDGITADDAQIVAMVAAAVQHLDGYAGTLGRSLISQTWKLSFHDFCGSWVYLPLPPLQSVTSVKYYSTSGVLTTISDGLYEVIPDQGYIHLLNNNSWPSDIDTDMAESIEITFIAGYGDTWNDVPEPIRLAICALVAHWYMYREPMAESLIELPMHIKSLLSPYRTYHV